MFTDRYRPARLLLLLASTAVVSSAAVAEEVAPTETVVINASRGLKLEDMDVSTSVLTHERVESSPENSVDQMLNKVPGVVISNVPSNQVHPTGKSVQMRGFGGSGAQRTLVMVDGIPINDPFYRYINWDKIPKDSIERVEVIRGGGATTQWGNMAMGGIINIVTRDPKPGERRLSAGYGSFNTMRVNAAATAYADDLFKLAFNASGMKTDGYNGTPEAYRNNHTSSTQGYGEDFEGQAILTPSETARYYLKAAMHDMNEFHATWDEAKNNQHSVEVKAGGKGKLGDGSMVDVNGWYGRYIMKTQNNSNASAYTWMKPDKDTGTYISSRDKNPYWDVGGSAVWKKDLDTTLTDVMVGVDGRNIWGKDSTQNIAAQGYFTTSTPLHGQQQFQGIFAQGTWRPLNPLEITVGLREDRWRAFDYEFNGVSASSYGDFSSFDPRLGAKWFVTDEVALRGAIYRNFSAPGMNQMFRSYGSSSSYFASNSALTPETNLGKEVGFEYRRSEVSFSATAFYNNLSSIIDKAKVCSSGAACAGFLPNGVTATSVTKYYNAGDAVVKGWEADTEWRALPTLTFNAGITRSIAYIDNNQRLANKLSVALANNYTPTHTQLGQVPPLLFTGGVTWEPISDLKLTTVVKSWPRMADDTQHTTWDSAGTVVDLGMLYRLDEHFDLYANVQNLFDSTYYNTGLNTTSTSTPPVQGQPVTVFGGFRMSY